MLQIVAKWFSQNNLYLPFTGTAVWSNHCLEEKCTWDTIMLLHLRFALCYNNLLRLYLSSRFWLLWAAPPRTGNSHPTFVMRSRLITRNFTKCKYDGRSRLLSWHPDFASPFLYQCLQNKVFRVLCSLHPHQKWLVPLVGSWHKSLSSYSPTCHTSIKQQKLLLFSKFDRG